MITYDTELQLHQSYKIPAFEGWYFRVVDNQVSIAVIIGIAKTKEKQEAFIQIFHTLNEKMEKVSYDIKDVQYQDEPFLIKIKDSIFSKNRLYIKDQGLSVLLDIKIKAPLSLKQTKYAPTIMGPFAYLKNMQCNHAVLNLGSSTQGEMVYQNSSYKIKGILYQEKDWGNSFPRKYIWVQSNCCQEKQAVLFLSCAAIPLKPIEFTGIIMVIAIGEKQYRFASYYGAFITKAKRVKDYFYLSIRQGKYNIVLKIKSGKTYRLDAPEMGEMQRNVEESLLGQVEMKLYEYHQCKEHLLFSHCGIENDHFFK
ncbi:tocopherol cyclase family protein [Beduini massiliensis]|uniref:tocopherol cyclase family protein n=1 Tax=Beduini massiliensis TaxID=1585974 RepID=UPI0009444B63|nr:tocopherol cyclase family protein [Beduini massiliensis]